MLNILLFNSFFKRKAVFSEKNCKKPFSPSLLKGRGRLATKMNRTFFMENEVLNIFHWTVFLKKAVFLEKMGKNNFWGTWPFFRRKGHLTLKTNITFFYRKLDAKNYYIRQFFRKKQYFLRKLQETVLGRIRPFFRKRGLLRQKITITFFLSRIR